MSIAPDRGARVQVLACTCYDAGEHFGMLGVVVGVEPGGALVRLDGWYRVPCLATEVRVSDVPLPAKVKRTSRKELASEQA